MLKATLSAAALIATLTLLPARSQAGSWYGTYPASCYKNADGSGGCTASALGLRTNVDPNAYVYIAGWSMAGYSPTAYFAIYLNGTYYSCFTSDPLVAERVNAITSHANVFAVSWNASGNCTSTASYLISYNQ